jgi:pimeloyl-ACP methyl ester carboxylesterase
MSIGEHSRGLVLVGALTLSAGCWDTVDIGADGTPGIMLEDIELRPGVTVDLFVNAYGDTEGIDSIHDLESCQFAIHGGVFAAASWRPYAEALGEGGCVLSADMPVRGNSGVPEGAQFGDLNLFDYVTALEEVLGRLEDLHVRPRTILGHSMGGTLTQMLQQRLVSEGSSLRQRYGIKEAILVASDLPADVPWALGDSGNLTGLIEAFAVLEPAYGLLFEIPVELWPAFYFTDLTGAVVPNALTPAEIVAGGFNALGEPLQAIHQLNGTGGFTSRPSAAAGLFEHGTRMRAIAYEQDIYVQLAESETLYQHLTGDEASNCFVPVLGADAVHTVQFSNPQALVDAIEGSEDCDY